MEAFSLLKYWRGGGVISGSSGSGSAVRHTTNATIVAAAASPDSDADSSDEGDDDGPFFDLEFAVPEGNEDAGEGDGVCREPDSSSSEDEDEGGEEDSDVYAVEGGEFNVNLTLSPPPSSSSSPASSVCGGDGCVNSPSDDLFFKGRLVTIEQGSACALANHNSSSKQLHHLPVSLRKSATKFRVFMLGLKKSKAADHQKELEKLPEKSQTTATATASSKLLAVRFKVEEVPIISLFTRDNSSKSSQKEAVATSSDEKIIFSKEALQRYLKKVKPLYIRVSKRYGEKLRFSGQLGGGTAASARKAHTEQSPSTAVAGGEAVKGNLVRQANIPTGLRVVCKHLGKSRSASSAAVAAAPSASSSSRRDDSLLQQQDGIQSAILHCKRSFNASRDSESSQLSRSVSEPLKDKSMALLSKSSQSS
ncbi:hypothetical protein SAY87_015214 [Trapa incisa]|uniref:Membrane-associated kinase regulator 2 n=1 Tax=Trapa incisa TaxID=236973 RepID=A0AAN7JM54_9MYRT|nr:hypothetical protein SAY87_015214 [Trapa incisa]